MKETKEISQEQLQKAITDYETAPQYTTQEIDQIVHEYAEACKETARLKEIHSQAYKREVEREQKLLSVLESVGKTSYQVSGVGKVTSVEKTTYQFPKDLSTREKIYSWIQDCLGRDGLLSYLSINAQSFSKLIRTTLENGEQVPVKIEEKKSQYISLKKE